MLEKSPNFPTCAVAAHVARGTSHLLDFLVSTLYSSNARRSVYCGQADGHPIRGSTVCGWPRVTAIQLRYSFASSFFLLDMPAFVEVHDEIKMSEQVFKTSETSEIDDEVVLLSLCSKEPCKER